MARFLIASLFAALTLATPIEERNLNCNAVNDIITIMHGQRVATPFCSSVLKIPTVTQTSTVTSTPACKTITQSVSSTATVTTISTSVVYGTTTVYPVVAVSTTSTCALGATVISSAGATTPSAGGASKRNNQPCTTSTTKPPGTTTAIGTPTCLTQFGGSALTSACSCLSIPTPTSVSITTTTLSQSTVTKVIASTASVTVTSVATTTSFTSTYSATQYYTSTFTILPAPSSTLNPASTDNEVYGVYPQLDFAGEDIQNFFCYLNGPAAPAPFTGTTCQSFSDCVSECAYYNNNKLGRSSNQTCGAVVYNAPADGSSGSCYLKTGQTGCGSPNSMVTTGVLLPLIPNDVQ